MVAIKNIITFWRTVAFERSATQNYLICCCVWTLFFHILSLALFKFSIIFRIYLVVKTCTERVRHFFFLFDPAWNNEEKITHTRARARASLLKKMLKDLRWNETRTRNKNRKSQKKISSKQASKHVLSHELNKNEFQGQIFQSSTLKTVFFAHTRTRVHKHFQTVLLLIIISLFLLLLLFLSKFVFLCAIFLLSSLPTEPASSITPL